MNIRVDATKENLNVVIDAIVEELDKRGCARKPKTQLKIAIEEIYINIVNYAYPQGTDAWAEIETDFNDSGDRVSITFIDGGTQYDPLAKEDPDVTLSAKERPIGGLGIFMVKKTMDDVRYRYEDGRNVFTIEKTITE